jgi:hypothetical protein
LKRVGSLKIEGERQGLEGVMEVSSMEEPSTNPTNKRQKLQISFVTPDPFAPLSNRDCDNSSAPAEEPKKLPLSIPPIFIKNVVNMNSLLTDFKGLNPGPFKHKTVNNEVKFNFETLEGYRTFMNYLIKNSAEYHTFQLKTGRGLHLFCDVPSMREELRSLSYDPVQMLPVRHPVTKMSLPIFFVGLRPNTKNIEYTISRGCIMLWCELNHQNRGVQLYNASVVRSMDTQKIIAIGHLAV